MIGGIVSFAVGIWNFVVGVAPVVFHTACALTQGASDTLKLGGGS